MIYALNEKNTDTLQLYSRKQVQQILGIGKSKMLSLLQSGQIASFRISDNGAYRIRKTDLEEFIENQIAY